MIPKWAIDSAQMTCHRVCEVFVWHLHQTDDMMLTHIMYRSGFWKMNGSESAKSRLQHEELARQLVRHAYSGHSSFTIAYFFIAS